MTIPTAATQYMTGTKSQSRARVTKRLKGLGIYVVLSLAAVTMVFPLLWLISSSLKAAEQQVSWPPSLIPAPVHPQNYVDLFRVAPMQVYSANSRLRWQPSPSPAFASEAGTSCSQSCWPPSWCPLP
jgi:ABC-type maltose transport system permease subunit